jgi:hypothetical protein
LESDPRDLDILSPLPSMMALHDDTGIVHLADSTAPVPDEGVNEPEPAGALAETTMSVGSITRVIGSTTAAADTTDDQVANQDAVNETSSAAAILLELSGTGEANQVGTGHNIQPVAVDGEIALIMKVKAALRERPDKATPMMKDKLRKMKTKKV